MGLFFYANMIRNIIMTFFQNSIWVVGFFYLLIKTFENETLKYFSRYFIGVILLLLFLYSVEGSI